MWDTKPRHKTILVHLWHDCVCKKSKQININNNETYQNHKWLFQGCWVQGLYTKANDFPKGQQWTSEIRNLKHNTIYISNSPKQNTEAEI